MPRAQKLLVELEDSIRAISSLSGEVRGTLRFATSHHIGLHRLPPTLKRFRQVYPQVRLDIRFMDSEAACVAVEHGELELGIVTLPPEPSSKLTTEVIWEDPLGIVVSRNHPLAGQADVTLDQLAQHVAVLPATNTYTRQIAELAFSRLGLTLEIALSTNYLETIKMLVSVGIGWSLLPNTMLGKHISKLSVEELSLQRSLGIVYHRDRTLSNAARALISELRNPDLASG